MSAPAFLDAYRGRAVLVTGHTGFKGSWLTLWLQELGASVFGVALEPEGGRDSLFVRAGVAEGMESMIADVRDPEAMTSAVARIRPTVVFHLAAQALVRRSLREPAATFETNVLGTVHVLEAVRRTPGVKAVVVVTSDKVYENPQAPRRESDAVGGSDPYSASKACADLVTTAYRRSFLAEAGTLVATARAGNVIGSGDASEDRIVPDIIRSLLADDPIRLRNPDSIRPWQHVLEPLRGYLMLGGRLLDGDLSAAGPWNLGPAGADAVTVRELARRVVDEWGTGTILEASGADPVSETPVLRLDITKARAELGFEPVLGLDDAIRMTVDGYRDLMLGDSAARMALLRQIAEYAARLS